MSFNGSLFLSSIYPQRESNVGRSHSKLIATTSRSIEYNFPNCPLAESHGSFQSLLRAHK